MYGQLLQSCLTQYDPVDGSPLGSSVPGILQARILEWVVMPSSTGIVGGSFFTHWAYLRRSDVKVAQLCPGILQARILEWVAVLFSRGSSQPRDRIQVSHIAGQFFTNWATREAKNTGSDSLSLLQWIFSTQELNWGLPHCRQILYQLSYQGSPAWEALVKEEPLFYFFLPIALAC